MQCLTYLYYCQNICCNIFIDSYEIVISWRWQNKGLNLVDFEFPNVHMYTYRVHKKENSSRLTSCLSILAIILTLSPIEIALPGGQVLMTAHLFPVMKQSWSCLLFSTPSRSNIKQPRLLQRKLDYYFFIFVLFKLLQGDYPIICCSLSCNITYVIVQIRPSAMHGR